MAIRLPLRGVLSDVRTTETGAGSVAGGIPLPFTILQDTDNVLVKFQASLAGAGASAVLQTTDDGGSTWMDVARTSIVSNAIHNTAGQNAQWISVPVAGFGSNTTFGSVVAVGSVVTNGGFISNVSSSTLAQQTYSGLPILSQQGRIFVRITGNITSAASNLLQTEVKINSQAAIS